MLESITKKQRSMNRGMKTREERKKGNVYGRANYELVRRQPLGHIVNKRLSFFIVSMPDRPNDHRCTPSRDFTSDEDLLPHYRVS